MYNSDIKTQLMLLSFVMDYINDPFSILTRFPNNIIMDLKNANKFSNADEVKLLMNKYDIGEDEYSKTIFLNFTGI